MIYYHATLKENVFSIIKEGLKTGYDGCTYLCKSEKECLSFFNLPNRFLKFIPEKNTWAFLDKIEIAVIPLELDESTVHESNDHNKAFIKADAYYIDYDIPKEKIPLLNKIQLYELHRPDWS